VVIWHCAVGVVTGTRLENWKTRRMTSSRILSRVDLVRTDVSEESSTSIIKVTIISELGTTFFIVTAVKTSNLTWGTRVPVLVVVKEFLLQVLRTVLWLSAYDLMA
jgi:hypothetical protein